MAFEVVGTSPLSIRACAYAWEAQSFRKPTARSLFFVRALTDQ